MRVFHRSIALICLLFLTISLAVAQDQTQPQTTTPPAAGRQGRHMRGDKVADRLQQMSQRLNLTDDQKTKIQPILQSEAQQIRSVHQNTSLTPDQRQAQVKQIRQNSQDQIKQLLTPEQVAKLGKGPHMGKGPGAAGGPPEMLEHMSSKLNLTDEQKSKLEPIFTNQRQQVQAIRQDSSLTDEQKRAKIDDLRKSTHQQVMSILTPEQQAQMKQMRGNRMHRNGRPAGAPPAGQQTPPPPGA